MKKLSLLLIKFYQQFLSPDTGIPHKFLPELRVCIFTPSCSEYAYQAIQKYGIIKGGLMGVKRILRCGPWSEGGYDPIA